MTVPVTPPERIITGARTTRLLQAAAVCVLVAGGAVVVARVWLGSNPADVPGIPGPDTLVTAGVPLLRLLSTMAGVATLAGLIATLVLYPPSRRGVVSRAGRRCLVVAAWTSGAWSLLCTAQAMWTFADILGLPLAQALDPEVVAAFWWDVPQVRTLLLMALVAATVSVTAAMSSTVVGAGAGAALTVVAMCLPTVSGHGGGSAQHAVSLVSGVVHAGGSTVWMAGVLALLAFAARAGDGLSHATRRLSSVTLMAVAALAISGLGNAYAQLNEPAELLTTRYGQLVILKAILLGGAASLGWWARRTVLGAWEAGSRDRLVFVRLLATELLVMVVAAAAGVALATSAPPRVVPQFATVGETLAGFSYPPPPTLSNVVLGFRPDPVFLLVCIMLGGLYAAGVIRLLRRGDSWPWGRTTAWMLGVLALGWCTNAGISAYANIAPGLHMGQHMALTMLVPILLVLGGPATLALRALRPSAGPHWGPREWLVYALHSRAAAILTNPLVVLVIYFAGLYGLYLSSAFATLMGSHVGHVAMQVHFILSGYLFYWILVGVDPRPKFLPYWQRFMILVLASALHGFFAVVIMMSTAPIAIEWFAVVQPPWMTDLLRDTVSGGQAAWAVGEFPLLIVAIAMAVQWSRSDDREARRSDRKADADGDKELIEYNAYLASLQRRSGESGAPLGPS